MNLIERRLVHLIEECNELANEMTNGLNLGFDNYIDDLRNELYDFLAIGKLLNEVGVNVDTSLDNVELHKLQFFSKVKNHCSMTVIHLIIKLEKGCCKALRFGLDNTDPVTKESNRDTINKLYKIIKDTLINLLGKSSIYPEVITLKKEKILKWEKHST